MTDFWFFNANFGIIYFDYLGPVYIKLLLDLSIFVV